MFDRTTIGVLQHDLIYQMDNKLKQLLTTQHTAHYVSIQNLTPYREKQMQ
jgi:hypothetical protein